MAIDPCLRSISPRRAELPEEPAISPFGRIDVTVNRVRPN